MAQDTTLTHGAPGIASFGSESYGGPSEPRFGEGVPTTTDHTVTAGADLDLPIYSVVSVIAGVLALAGAGVAQGSASGTITFSSTGPVTTETVTIGTRVYTLKSALSTGPAVANEVLISATPSVMAANLAAAINAGAGAGTLYSTGTLVHADVAASPSAGVVTIVARDPGDEGNSIALTETGTNTAASAATLTGGSDDPDALPFGILAHPVVLANAASMSVSIYRGGHWDMDQLHWGAAFITDAQKKVAFENSRSPNIFISKKRFNNDQITI